MTEVPLRLDRLCFGQANRRLAGRCDELGDAWGASDGSSLACCQLQGKPGRSPGSIELSMTLAG